MVNRPNVNSDNVKLPKLYMREFLRSLSPALLLMQSPQNPTASQLIKFQRPGRFSYKFLSFFFVQIICFTLFYCNY